MSRVYIVHEIPAEDVGRMVLIPADSRDGYSASLIGMGDALACVEAIMRADQDRTARETRAAEVEAAKEALEQFDAEDRFVLAGSEGETD